MSEKVSDARLVGDAKLDQMIREWSMPDFYFPDGKTTPDAFVLSALRELRELRAVAERAKFGDREG